MSPPKLTLVSDNTKPMPAEQTVSADATSSLDADTNRERIVIDLDAENTDRAPLDPAHIDNLRAIEAVLFQATEPLDEQAIAERIGGGLTEDLLRDLIQNLVETYQSRGVNLVKVAGKWAFRTAGDLSYLLETHSVEERRLSKAALETLAIIAYHQPVTRAEIEDIRGVTTSAGTLDILMESGWIRPRGRRRAPGKPLTYGTTESFLSHFGLDTVKDLPGLADLRSAGLLDGNLPPDFSIPDPTAVAALMPDELPLDSDEDEDQTELDLDGETEGLDETEADAANPDTAPDLPDEAPVAKSNTEDET